MILKVKSARDLTTAMRSARGKRSEEEIADALAMRPSDVRIIESNPYGSCVADVFALLHYYGIAATIFIRPVQ